MDFRVGDFSPPRLDFLRRFRFDAMNNQLQEVERDTTAPLMGAFFYNKDQQVKFLSDVAKENAIGGPENRYENLLPDVDIAAAMIHHEQNRQKVGTGPVDAFPYKLKAVGPVNAMEIFNRAGQPGTLVSNVVEIVP